MIRYSRCSPHVRNRTHTQNTSCRRVDSQTFHSTSSRQPPPRPAPTKHKQQSTPISKRSSCALLRAHHTLHHISTKNTTHIPIIIYRKKRKHTRAQTQQRVVVGLLAPPKTFRVRGFLNSGGVVVIGVNTTTARQSDDGATRDVLQIWSMYSERYRVEQQKMICLEREEQSCVCHFMSMFTV